MRNRIKEIYARADIKQIRSFVLEGADAFDDFRTFEQRLEDQKEIFERLQRLYPDEIELDDAVSDLSKALNSYENVYTEIGMQIGARIIYQLLLQDYV